MKRPHRPDLHRWSCFDEARDLDFHSVIWVRVPAHVAIDPLPLSAHDAAHLTGLGGVELIVVTHSDRLRAAAALAAPTGARVAPPRAERGRLRVECTLSLGEDDQPAPGLRVLGLEGSKTPGELAPLLEEAALLCELLASLDG